MIELVIGASVGLERLDDPAPDRCGQSRTTVSVRQTLEDPPSLTISYGVWMCSNKFSNKCRIGTKVPKCMTRRLFVVH